jgi:hypothetical protein
MLRSANASSKANLYEAVNSPSSNNRWTFTMKRICSSEVGGIGLLPGEGVWLRGKFGEPRPDWYLFPFSNTRRPIDPTRPLTTIKTAWESVKTDSKVSCRFHVLRHTAITKLAEQGVPDSTMKALAGHVHEKMLERYSHIRMEAKRTAVEALALPKVVNQGRSEPNAKANAKVTPKNTHFCSG